MKGWMMAAVSLLGLGVAVLYRNHKRVGVPHRWYL